jgi:hypothetical protein
MVLKAFSTSTSIMTQIKQVYYNGMTNKSKEHFAYGNKTKTECPLSLPTICWPLVINHQPRDIPMNNNNNNLE